MPKDNKKHSYSLRSRKKHTKVEKKKSKEELKKTCYVESSSDSDDSIWSEIDEEFDMKEYRHFLAKIFPSQYARERAVNTESGNKRGRRGEASSTNSPASRKNKKRRFRKHAKNEDNIVVEKPEPEEHIESERVKKKKVEVLK